MYYILSPSGSTDKHLIVRISISTCIPFIPTRIEERQKTRTTIYHPLHLPLILPPSQLRPLPPPHPPPHSLHARPSNLLILPRRPRTNANSTHTPSPHLNRQPATDDTEPAAVRVVNPKSRPAWEEVLGARRVGVRRRGRTVARGREGFVDGGLDAGQLCGGHAREGEVEGAVYEGYVEVCVVVRSCFFTVETLCCTSN